MLRESSSCPHLELLGKKNCKAMGLDHHICLLLECGQGTQISEAKLTEMVCSQEKCYRIVLDLDISQVLSGS